MRLSELARQLDRCELRGEDIAVKRLQLDSRAVEPGDLFAALPGIARHGLEFLDAARAAGAAALLAPAGSETPAELPTLYCEAAARAAGCAAHLLAGDPSAGWPLLGVTGTNGKTTSAYLLSHLLGEWGLLGSVSYRTGGRDLAASHTTPDAARLALYLAEMRAGGAPGAVMEVSSHALDQERVAGCRYAGALFTHLSRDHLDYHGDMESYFAAKCRLLEHLTEEAPVVFGADDPWMARLGALRPGALSFGRGQGADFRVLQSSCEASGSRFRASWRGEELQFQSPLLGAFNVDNAAGALALCLALGREPGELDARLRDFPGVPGRLEALRGAGGPTVILDFAHTPDAIEKVVAACRPLCRGRLRVLVGAGGDRDRGKRPLMARAAQAADFVCLTSDNPRSEDPEAILDEVEAGMDPAGSPWLRLADRREAIARVLAEAENEDMVLLLGKGHEKHQEIAGIRHPFSDRDEALRALEGRPHEG